MRIFKKLKTIIQICLAVQKITNKSKYIQTKQIALIQIQIPYRVGPVYNRPSTNKLQQGAEEGEAHCINSNANGTYDIFNLNFFYAIIFYYDAN